jgi:hypothetical protein
LTTLKLFFEELHADTFSGQLPHDATQIVEVAGETVHGVHDAVSPSRTKLSSASSCGRWVSLPDALSVKMRSTVMPSSCQSARWSRLLTRM